MAVGRDVASSVVPSEGVEDGDRVLVQAIAMLGAKDPQITSTGEIDGRLQLQFHFYSRQGPPSLQGQANTSPSPPPARLRSYILQGS